MGRMDERLRSLRDLNRAVALDLWMIHDNDLRGPRLMLPARRDASERISEQESKIVFCHRLERSDWLYSIETPTSETYRQTGSQSLSARTDVSLYGARDTGSKLVNIELKAHNPPLENFRKDLEKLLREGLDGVWFHTLKSANRGTLPSIFRKMRESFRRLEDHVVGPDRTMLFAFCVLDPSRRRLLQADLTISGPVEDTIARIDGWFQPDSLEAWVD